MLQFIKPHSLEETIMKQIISAIPFTLMLLIVLVIAGTVAEESVYTPQPGDEVVVYFVKYKPESFEEGKKLHAKEFAKAMQESGQTRLTYFLEDAEKHNIMAISFFKKGHEVKEWHSNTKRQEVLDKLKPLWREPPDYREIQVS